MLRFLIFFFLSVFIESLIRINREIHYPLRYAYKIIGLNVFMKTNVSSNAEFFTR